MQGEIQISKAVIESISKITLDEIEGIYKTNKIKTSGKLFSSVSEDLNDLNIDIFLTVKTGYKIKTITTLAQKQILSNIKSMTGLDADSINIYVDDIVEKQ
ncbi:MAG: Asp23/Gls24 family envelope stress response protein [Eubacteriaceae bacterium]|nr:Asp23/Gls24 family envelope stress response protein [Eubacteriaceae bacterium]